MAFNALTNVFKIAELRQRLIYTVLLLGVYRIGIFITTPGVDRQAMQAFMESQKAGGGLVSLFNLFSGGALEQMSIFGLGIMPYVSASIVMQLMTVVVPRLEQLQKEGAAGRQKINQYTRYGSIALSIIQGVSISRYLGSLGRGAPGSSGFDQIVVPDTGWYFTFLTVISLTAGTAFIMWLGERITENGIGNGISLIIFAGIVARIPGVSANVYTSVQTGVMNLAVVLVLLAFMVFVVGVVVFMERGMRRLPVQYAKRATGQGLFAGQSSYFPMKVNASGVIPPIFAGALLSFPGTLAGWIPALGNVQQSLQSNIWLYDGLFVLLIVFFSYFYTALTFRPEDVADNIKKQGGYIPGIRPGRQTAEFIERVLNRLTFGGAVYLSVICVIPTILMNVVGSQDVQFGGTALLIVVGVALDTVQQIEGHLINRDYDGFAGPKGPRIRGRVRATA